MTNSITNFSSSSNYHAGAGIVNNNMKPAAASRANIRASCYAVDAVTTALSGFHYSTTRAAGVQHSGGPEVTSLANETPPHSPPFAAQACVPSNNKSRTPSPPSPRREGSTSPTQSGKRGPAAAYTITEECERLFCETLRAVFSGERDRYLQDSLVTGARIIYSSSNDSAWQADGARAGGDSNRKDRAIERNTKAVQSGFGTPPPDFLLGGSGGTSFVSQWIEVWDYTGGVSFRGFIAEASNRDDRTLFIFFDETVFGKDLKQGLMALIELASIPAFACDRLVVCFDRRVDTSSISKNLLRDLRWVGFELTTLANWTGGVDVTSERWLFLGMDVSG